MVTLAQETRSLIKSYGNGCGQLIGANCYEKYWGKSGSEENKWLWGILERQKRMTKINKKRKGLVINEVFNKNIKNNWERKEHTLNKVLYWKQPKRTRRAHSSLWMKTKKEEKEKKLRCRKTRRGNTTNTG